MTLTRRDFLKSSALLATWTALSACRPQDRTGPSPLTPETEGESVPAAALSNDELLLHTLKRTSFGLTPKAIKHARRIGLESYLEEQLSPDTLQDDTLEAQLEQLSTLSMTPAERYALERQGQPVEELIRATLLRQWTSQRQLYEVMVDFWSNHFNIFIGKSLCRVLKTDDDQQVVRPNSLGNFNDLLRASAHSPAMLVYLDQATSKGDAPNENYARELLELHTLGVNGGYDQTDVQEVARVFTGWSVAPPRSLLFEPGRFLFNPRAHAGGEKHVLGVVIPSGGEEEGNLVLETLAANPSTARFLSQKLARRFIADDPPNSIVDTLAASFSISGGDIPTVLQTLFTSAEFKASAGQKFKRPLEFFLSALRATGARVNELNRGSRQIQEHLRTMGQIPFTWSPPNGYPDVAGYWFTTSGLLQRWNFGSLLVSNQVRGLEVNLKDLTREAASTEDIVDLLSLRFLGQVLPEPARDILVDFAMRADPDQDLPSIAGLILGSPYFQVR